MKELGKWQVISFISRGIAMVLGIVQSFVIIRVLSVGEWGIVQLAASIGAALGIYQNLGLASASTREIASAKDDSEIFQIFVTSVAIRYFVTLPIAIGLFAFAKPLAVGIYKNAALILPLRIYGATLLFQGFQSILNSVIMGTKRFKRLFTYQVAIAALSVVIFVPLVVMYRVNGYFWAYLAFNLINTITLAFLAFGPLKGKLAFPSKKDFILLFREIFSISVAIYLVKILSTNWEAFGTNVLGLFSKPEVVAIFAFAALYAGKITSISDAVTDVNLPVLSEKYVKNIAEFSTTFLRNFDKVFGFIILTATVACFWAPQIIRVVVGSEKYAASYTYIPVMLLGYIIYSVIDIAKSSIFVPAKHSRRMVFSYVILLAGTAGSYFVFASFMEKLASMAWAFAAGGAFCLTYMLISTKKTLHFEFMNIDHAALLLQFYFVGWFGVNQPTVIKLWVFPVLIALTVYSLFISKIFEKSDLAFMEVLWKKRK